MYRRLSFNSIINTFLTAHNHWCQRSIPKRWNTLALPNYFPCAPTCVCVCAHLNNLNQPDIIIFHLQLRKWTLRWAPCAICISNVCSANTCIYYDLQRQGGKLARLTVLHLSWAAASLHHAAESTVALEKLWIITAHLVGINLLRKSLAGIRARRTELWHYSVGRLPTFPPPSQTVAPPRFHIHH